MNQNEIIQRSKSKNSKVLLFGVPKLGTSILIGLVDFALLALYTIGYQLTPLLAGIALGIGKLTIAASQFFFGWISDAKYTRWGRRKPYLVVLSLFLSSSFLLLLLPSLFIDINDASSVFIWFLVWNIMFNISYGVTTPYNAWMAEQFSIDERPKVSQFQNLFGFIGTAIMAVFAMVVLTDFNDDIQTNPDIIPPDFLYSIVIFAIIPLILFCLIVIFMPKEPHFKIDSNMIDNLKTILKNKNFLLVTVMQGIASIAWIMTTSLILVFISTVLQFDSTSNLIASIVFMLGILIFLVLWRKLIEKLGRKRSLLYIFLTAIIFLPFTLLGLLPMGSTFIFGIIFILGITGCMGGWFLFPSIIYADIATDDEKSTGELKAGIYTGFPSIILNLFQALGLFIMGMILELPSLGTLSYSIGYVLWGPICSLILICAYFFARKFIKLDFEQ
ncbi:MAG: MFS transporter [Candidatus Lokiarchaeota archaeon]|nr:MFS transporter [Candidatus Lokiarchaeota archaeon]